MIVNQQLATSKGFDQKDLWATPSNIFNPLNEEFIFTLDPCCTHETAKAKKYYTPIEDGLSQSWEGETAFVNPPYSRGNIDLWAEKCYLESLKPFTTVVALLPVSTSAKWWHKWVMNNAQIRFYQGRIKFVGAPFTAPFSSVLAIYSRLHKPQEFEDYSK